MEADKSCLREELLKQAYTHPYANIVFKYWPSLCPQCGCEYVNRLDNVRFICQGCGHLFTERQVNVT